MRIRPQVLLAFSIAAALILITSSSGCVESITGLFGRPAQITRTEWAFEATQINSLNSLGFHGAGVVIGIVDTGIDLSHPDLRNLQIGKNLVWMDLINSRAAPYDDNGHGTHVAGIVFADGKLKGIAPLAKLIMVKAISLDGSGNDDVVAGGIDYCVQEGADVIILSLGGQTRRLAIGDACAISAQNAAEQGVFVVAAAGNDGGPGDDGNVASPATMDGVIAVGAVQSNKTIADFSSKGDNTNSRYRRFSEDERHQDPSKKPEVAAPGVEIMSTYTNGGYAIMSGTSQATPFVGGAIALILGALPTLQHENSAGYQAVWDFKDALMDTAEKSQYQQVPHDDYYGYGLIRAYDAYAAMKG